MKKSFGILVLLLIFGQVISAQQKKITLEDIWGGSFSAERLEVLRSMKDGQHYTILNIDREAKVSSIDKYEYKTQEKVATLLESDAANGIPFFTSYGFSEDESRVLLATAVEPVYRRSRLGIYFVYDLETNTIFPISETKIKPYWRTDEVKVGWK